ncbi:VOC family protein [Nocardioides sambongensis]|uniref:VOC family protein n=1 Tax=Nocardioides sambongensis TaxID=2589074 RepID=UPI001E2EBA56|nr:VOC family protein [Nocardioides sambongensis]
MLPGEDDRVLAVGWEVRDQYALDAVARDVEASGRAVKTLGDAECRELGVEAAIAFDDPAGTRLEVFFGPTLDHSPVLTRWGQKFHTGAEGLGHVVLPTPHAEETVTFYEQVLGFLPRGAMRMGDGPSRIRFLGINRRHHSLAVCAAPHGEAPGLVHLMVEVDDLDAVGRALDEINKRGFSLSSTLGRHTNDKMISFYVRAPGGWDIEYGCEGMLVDETSYTAEEITADSYWGHDWIAPVRLAAFTPPS